ncbi:pseudouridine synthase pus4 [Oleoguttula sp. CCFEE 5521]
MTSTKIPEGCFAINKPRGITSAQVIRDVQVHFNPSKLFKPWVDAERQRQMVESHNQRKKRSKKFVKPIQIKMGHGGTLDPLATGVLILGVGSGTKSLGNFLACTKSYEAVLLFGRATDSYDTEGEVVAKKGFEHVTRESVEEAMGKFRGKMMQRPPIFSAIRIQGKRLYEYAREGKEVPVEIEERPVEVEKLEMGEWMEGGTHEYRWPEAEAGREEKVFADKVLHFGSDITPEPEATAADGEEPGQKRKREADEDEGFDENVPQFPKRPKSSSAPERPPQTAAAAPPAPPCPAPACRIRMTVTSGFYVRSLCHDLGLAVGSLGIMASLIRSRQGDFELGKNVFEYSELAKGETFWGPQVEGMLEEWTTEKAEALAQAAPMTGKVAKGEKGPAGGRHANGDEVKAKEGQVEAEDRERRRNSSSVDA